jgi:hypothetical protein
MVLRSSTLYLVRRNWKEAQLVVLELIKFNIEG